jgi:hypothetical protein
MTGAFGKNDYLYRDFLAAKRYRSQTLKETP